MDYRGVPYKTIQFRSIQIRLMSRDITRKNSYFPRYAVYPGRAVRAAVYIYSRVSALERVQFREPEVEECA